MRSFLLCLVTAMIVSAPALADTSATSTKVNNGLISIKSNHNVKVTADRLVDALKKKGMNVFARINHAEGAATVGKELRPTELVIFGNPKVGTPLMQCAQSVAIDLPQKALVWQDVKGEVWLSYNDPAYIAKRHNINNCKEVIGKISIALTNFSMAATKP